MFFLRKHTVTAELNARSAPADLTLRIDRVEALHALRVVPLVANAMGGTVVWNALGGWQSLPATGWFVVMLLFLATDLLIGSDLRGSRPRADQLLSDERRAIFFCITYGTLWGALMTIFYSSADPDTRHLLTLVIAVYLASAPLVLAAAPVTVFAFAIPVMMQTVPVLIANGIVEHAFVLQMLAVYLVAFPLTLRYYWRSFAERAIAIAEVDAQKHLIAVLLDDFKASKSDWLWQTDAQLRFQKLAETFQKHGTPSRDPIVGHDVESLVSWLFMVNEAVDPGAAEVLRLMQAREPFREVVVTVHRDGLERCWAISGSPSLDRNNRFSGYRGIGRDITDKRRAERELTHLAHHDALTGGANRASFNRELDRIGAAMEHEDRRFALIQFDLDDFKAVNDTAGHAAGDEVLRQAYRRMAGEMPEGAFLARIGGDEFVAILEVSEETPPNEIRQLAEAMVDAVTQPIDAASGVFQIGASAGIALMPDNGRDAHAVMKLADIALYHAKGDDISRVHLASAADGAAYSYRKILERDLRSAVDREELELYFQPIVDAATGRTTVLEALLRWRHPILGFVSPVEFIPIAEQTGSIQQIGNWALREACRHAVDWPEGVRVAVNISAREFDHNDLSVRVLEALDESGLRPERLELEITESAFLGSVERVRKIVTRMQAHGVSIAMDDFGTGYSSLSSLQDVPFDKLKIDRSLVARDRNEKGAVSILKSIVAIGSALDLHVTAEGVETAEQAAFLKGLGCNSLQGYLFARPMPAIELPVLFAREAKRMLEDNLETSASDTPASQSAAG